MKRQWLLLACMILLAGCAAREEAESGVRYALYFLEPEPGSGVLQAESVTLPEEREGAEAASALVEALLAGPSDPSLRSPIPSGTGLLSLEVREGRALVDLSAPYGTLSGVGLTLADYAVTLTLTQLPEVLSVQITVRGQELAYRDRQILTARDVLLYPEEDVMGTVQAELYFLDGAGRLRSESRTLDLYEGDTQAAAVVRALEEGPEGKGLSPVLPPEFRVRSQWMEEDVCYVNLSSAALEALPPEADLASAIRAVGRSLCSLEAVSETRFLVNGEFEKTYGGVDISEPVTG